MTNKTIFLILPILCTSMFLVACRESPEMIMGAIENDQALEIFWENVDPKTVEPVSLNLDAAMLEFKIHHVNNTDFITSISLSVNRFGWTVSSGNANKMVLRRQNANPNLGYEILTIDSSTSGTLGIKRSRGY